MAFISGPKALKSECVSPRPCVPVLGWLWCIYCSELAGNNSSFLAHVSGGRQQHSAFPALCVPVRLGVGLGFHSHLELRAQECHCSSFQIMAGSDTHTNTHLRLHINRHTWLVDSMQEELIPTRLSSKTWVTQLCYVVIACKNRRRTSGLCDPLRLVISSRTWRHVASCFFFFLLQTNDELWTELAAHFLFGIVNLLQSSSCNLRLDNRHLKWEHFVLKWKLILWPDEL